MTASAAATVYLVDDDDGVRQALARVLAAEGFDVRPFPSALAFLDGVPPEADGCLVLDLTMPGLDGLALQSRLAAAGRALPIVFVTGNGDIPASVRAIKGGAIDFLVKPVRAEALVAAIRTGLAQFAEGRAARTELAMLRARLASLTARQREILDAVLHGQLNKQIAATLGIAEQTVKFHRARIMERVGARTAAELMHIVARVDAMSPPASRPADET